MVVQAPLDQRDPQVYRDSLASVGSRDSKAHKGNKVREVLTAARDPMGPPDRPARRDLMGHRVRYVQNGRDVSTRSQMSLCHTRTCS